MHYSFDSMYSKQSNPISLYKLILKLWVNLLLTTAEQQYRQHCVNVTFLFYRFIRLNMYFYRFIRLNMYFYRFIRLNMYFLHLCKFSSKYIRWMNCLVKNMFKMLQVLICFFSLCYSSKNFSQFDSAVWPAITNICIYIKMYMHTITNIYLLAKSFII